MRLSKAQRRALMLAYADDYDLCCCSDPELGTSPRTVTALLERGLLEERDRGPADEEDPRDERSWAVTKAGCRALGVHVPPSARPKRFRTALRLALRRVLDWEPPIRSHRDINGMWDDDGREFDFRGSLAVIELAECAEDLDFPLGTMDPDAEDYEVYLSVIATMLTDMGFPCYAEADERVVAFWPDEE